MIIVTVELVPGGDMSKKRHLGTAVIANKGTGGLTRGNYRFQLSKRGRSRQLWKGGTITGFPRKKLGPWDLLYRCLREIVGSRNQ